MRKIYILWLVLALIAVVICIGAILLNNHPSYINPQPKNNQNDIATGECPPEEETAKMKNDIEIHNDAIAIETKYSGNGISIDFGKYGFTVIDDKTIGFGPWLLAGDPCPEGITQMYIMTFIGSRPKEEIINDVKSREFGTEEGYSDRLLLKDTKEIDGFDIVIWEEASGYPTYSLLFEIPGKDMNYLVKTNSLYSGASDYQKVLDILETARIEK